MQLNNSYCAINGNEYSLLTQMIIFPLCLSSGMEANIKFAINQTVTEKI